jgi:formate dehydrogenase major subunit
MGLRDLLPLFPRDERGAPAPQRDRRTPWPAARQLTGPDRRALGEAARSPATDRLVPRTDEADEVVPSICPFCAVGCGQRIFVRDGEVTHIEGDPDSPISRGRLCPRGSSTREMVTGPARETTVRYRRPGGTEWEELDLDTAMDMIADRVVAARDDGWEDTTEQGSPLNRTMAFGSLGGAALDNEENYLLKKLFTALGAIQIENQARI